MQRSTRNCGRFRAVASASSGMKRRCQCQLSISPSRRAHTTRVAASRASPCGRPTAARNRCPAVTAENRSNRARRRNVPHTPPKDQIPHPAWNEMPLRNRARTLHLEALARQPYLGNPQRAGPGSLRGPSRTRQAASSFRRLMIFAAQVRLFQSLREHSTANVSLAESAGRLNIAKHFLYAARKAGGKSNESGSRHRRMRFCDALGCNCLDPAAIAASTPT